MKRKHHGLISIGIVVMVLFPTVIYAVYSLEIPFRINTIRLSKISPDITVPDKTVIKELSMLEERMVDLVDPVKSGSVSDENLRFWRYSDQKNSHYQAVNQGEVKKNIKTSHALTFTFASGDKKFCIIDGSFYTQGADLPDGGKIMKIESGRVRVKKGDLAAWISLPETAKWGEIQ